MFVIFCICIWVCNCSKNDKHKEEIIQRTTNKSVPELRQIVKLCFLDVFSFVYFIMLTWKNSLDLYSRTMITHTVTYICKYTLHAINNNSFTQIEGHNYYIYFDCTYLNIAPKNVYLYLRIRNIENVIRARGDNYSFWHSGPFAIKQSKTTQTCLFMPWSLYVHVTPTWYGRGDTVTLWHSDTVYIIRKGNNTIQHAKTHPTCATIGSSIVILFLQSYVCVGQYK